MARLAVLLACGLLAWALWLYAPSRPASRNAVAIEEQAQSKTPGTGSVATSALQDPSGVVATPAVPGRGDPEPSSEAVEKEETLRSAAQAAERRAENRAGFPVAGARFAAEQRDPDWADERERALRQAWDALGVGTELQSVECRRSLCELKVRLGLEDPTHDLDGVARHGRALGSEYFVGGPADQETEARADPGLSVIYTTADLMNVDPAAASE